MGYAITTWLDLELAQRHADRISRALHRLLPQQGGQIKVRLAGLKQDLQRLDGRLRAAAKGRGRPLLASHPVYQYLRQRYGLNLRSLHWEPDRMPEETEWRRLAALQRAGMYRTMLWEADPLPGIRTRLREMGIATLVYNPTANRPAAGDFLTVMQGNVDRLVALLLAPH
jgi:zinc transport system substrate-binding protein